MSLMFCAAVFARGPKSGAESSPEISHTVARIVLGDRASLQERDIEFDECLDQVFPTGVGTRLFRKSVNRAAISVTDDRVILVSNRCGDWVGSEPEFLALCTHVNCQMALVLYLDSRVNSALYFLWESGKVIRSFASRDFNTAPSGNPPEIEDRLRQEGLPDTDIVDGVAEILLGQSFSDAVWDYSFDLWSA